MNKKFAAVGVGFGVMLGACSSSPDMLEVERSESFGVPGAEVVIEGEAFTDQMRLDIEEGIADVRNIGACTMNVTVRDMNDADPSEPFMLPNAIRPVAVGGQGGNIYIDTKQLTPEISIVGLLGHESAHACIEKGHEVEIVELPVADFRGDGGQLGFTLTGVRISDGQPNMLSAIDEATAEIVGQEATGITLPEVGYGPITTLLRRAMNENDMDVTELAELHTNSDLAGLVEQITGDTPTQDRTLCVLEQFGALQANAITFADAYENLQDC